MGSERVVGCLNVCVRVREIFVGCMNESGRGSVRFVGFLSPCD